MTLVELTAMKGAWDPSRKHGMCFFFIFITVLTLIYEFKQAKWMTYTTTVALNDNESGLRRTVCFSFFTLQY